jgi:hypothetical protein
MDFFEVSAKDGTNITEMFDKIGRTAYEKINILGDKRPNANILLDKETIDSNNQGGKSCSC